MPKLNPPCNVFLVAKNVVLSRSARDAVTGAPISDAESGSDWETDPEDRDSQSQAEADDEGDGGDDVKDVNVKVELVQDDDGDGSFSYSSILKSSKSKE